MMVIPLADKIGFNCREKAFLDINANLFKFWDRVASGPQERWGSVAIKWVVGDEMISQRGNQKE